MRRRCIIAKIALWALLVSDAVCGHYGGGYRSCAFFLSRGDYHWRCGGTLMPPKTESEQQGPESRPQFDGFGMFIAMDPPKHDVRATVASVAPRNSAVLERLIRERAGSI